MPTSQEIKSDIGDQALMQAILDFQRNKNVDVLAITQDDTFQNIAVAKEIETQRLDILPVSEVFKERYRNVDWNNIARFIYVLAVIFGVLKVSIGSVKASIYGVWAGKKKDDWERENIKIETDNPKFIKKARLMIEPLII